MINLKLLIFTNKYILEVTRKFFIYLSALVLTVSCVPDKGKEQNNGAQQNKAVEFRLTTIDGSPERTVSIDTMDIRNPFVRYDRNSNTYYMFGDGGGMWKSKDMRVWNGPYNVLDIDNAVWYNSVKSVIAPEVHKHDGHYYYLASFGRDSVGGEAGEISNRSCVALVADEITGPYRNIDKESVLIAQEEIASYPTFVADEFNAGYMIYTHDYVKEGDSSLKIIRFNDSFSRRLGEAYVMLKSSDVVSLTDKNGNRLPVQSIESPYLFVTDCDEAGLLFTANCDGESVIGVAYTKKSLGHWLNGPWVAEPEPLVSGNVGGASLFTDYDGTRVMAFHKDTLLNGKHMSLPCFMKVDTELEKLKIKEYYNF